jgi:hypothetical protein
MTSRMMRWVALAGGPTIASPAFAASSVDDATAALSFWMVWGLVYLGIGVVLMGIATAAALHERHAWSLLLSWPTEHERLAPPDDGIGMDMDASIEGEDAAIRAA